MGGSVESDRRLPSSMTSQSSRLSGVLMVGEAVKEKLENGPASHENGLWRGY
jgi:hypothetical protein